MRLTWPISLIRMFLGLISPDFCRFFWNAQLPTSNWYNKYHNSCYVNFWLSVCLLQISWSSVYGNISKMSYLIKKKIHEFPFNFHRNSRAGFTLFLAGIMTVWEIVFVSLTVCWSIPGNFRGIYNWGKFYCLGLWNRFLVLGVRAQLYLLFTNCPFVWLSDLDNVY